MNCSFKCSTKAVYRWVITNKRWISTGGPSTGTVCNDKECLDMLRGGIKNYNLTKGVDYSGFKL